MGAHDILSHLQAAGISLTRRGDSLLAVPRVAVTEQLLNTIRDHKHELLAALADQSANPPSAATTIAQDKGDQTAGAAAIAARRARLLSMLEAQPKAYYAVLTADDGDGPVIVAIAIRDKATFELEIERSRYDGVLLLDLIERHKALFNVDGDE